MMLANASNLFYDERSAGLCQLSASPRARRGDTYRMPPFYSDLRRISDQLPFNLLEADIKLSCAVDSDALRRTLDEADCDYDDANSDSSDEDCCSDEQDEGNEELREECCDLQTLNTQMDNSRAERMCLTKDNYHSAY